MEAGRLAIALLYGLYVASDRKSYGRDTLYLVSPRFIANPQISRYTNGLILRLD